MSRKNKGSYTTVKQSKNSKGSSTRGILKGANCQKSDLKVQFCKDNRMYKTNPKRFLEAEKIVRELNK